MNLQIEGIKLPPVAQLGIVVHDVEKSAANYERLLGIGPWEFREIDRPDATVHGKLSPYRVRVGMASFGGLQFELIQILDGETTQTEFLREKGEGIHHLGFRVENLDEDIASFAERGIGILQTHRSAGRGFAYMDTVPLVGIICELIQAPRLSQ